MLPDGKRAESRLILRSVREKRIAHGGTFFRWSEKRVRGKALTVRGYYIPLPCNALLMTSAT